LSSVEGIIWTRGPGTYRYTYNANGQQTKIAFPNGQKRNFTYDDQGRLTQLSNMIGTTNLATFDYEYDKDNDTGLFTVLGQRTKVTADVPALSASKTRTEYFYDGAYQLVRARTTAPSITEEAWTYDAIGNRLTQTAGGTTTSYAYVKNGTNPNNSARLATAGTETASHDFDGNMTALGTMSFTWDPLNRLKSRSVAGTPYTYTFSYDARDRRTAIDYQSTKFIYQGQNLVATSYRKAGGYYAANYLFGPGIDEPLARVDSTSVTYYSVDGLGSAILVSDDTGTVKNKYSYNSWSELKTASETVVQPFRYTAREAAVLDPAGFTERQYYYRARYLVPAIGRFITEDPSRHKTADLNFYRYVGNQPVLYIDPMGMVRQPPPPQTEPPNVKCTGCSPAIEGNARDALNTVCRNTRLNGGCAAVLRRYGLYDCFRDKCGRTGGGEHSPNVRCIDPGCDGCGGPCNNVSNVSQTIYLQPYAGSGLCGSLANTVAHEFGHMCGIGPDVFNAQNQRMADNVAAACGGPR
jgi:RHS repeat-associated protein